MRKLTSAGLWVLLALGAIGGFGTIGTWFSGSTRYAQTATPVDRSGETALAMHVAKVWMTTTQGETVDQRQKAIQDFLPSESLQNWSPVTVTQTPSEMYVGRVDTIAPSYVVVSVDAWCGLSTGAQRHVVLNVPIRTVGKSYAVAGEPVIVTPPALGQVIPSTAKDASESVYQTAGPFLNDFMNVYLTSTNSTDLANDVAPGVTVTPIGGEVAFQKISDSHIHDLGKGQYEAVLTVVVKDSTTGMTVPEQFLVDLQQDDKGHLEVEKVWTH